MSASVDDRTTTPPAAHPERSAHEGAARSKGGLVARPEQLTRCSLSDEALYSLFHERGDERAFEALATRHRERLVRVSRAIVGDASLAEDAAQEALLAVARSRGWRGEGEFAAWVTRVAVLHSRMALRARRRRVLHEGRWEAIARAPGADADTAIDLEEQIARLPEDVRRPLVLRYAEGMTHAEVARALGVAGGTASSRLRRGLALLRAGLGAGGYAAVLLVIVGIAVWLSSRREAVERVVAVASRRTAPASRPSIRGCVLGVDDPFEGRSFVGSGGTYYGGAYFCEPALVGPDLASEAEAWRALTAAGLTIALLPPPEPEPRDEDIVESRFIAAAPAEPQIALYPLPDLPRISVCRDHRGLVVDVRIVRLEGVLEGGAAPVPPFGAPVLFREPPPRPEY